MAGESGPDRREESKPQPNWLISGAPGEGEAKAARGGSRTPPPGVFTADLCGDVDRARRGGAPVDVVVASADDLESASRGLFAVSAAAVSLATEAEIGFDGPACDAEKDSSKTLGSSSSLLRWARTAGVRRSASGSDEARTKRDSSTIQGIVRR
jgi:hypothetical protein